MIKCYNKRIMLKLSGEMLGGTEGGGLKKSYINLLADEIVLLNKADYEVGVVIGGGNFFRGSLAKDFNIERAGADYMGMLGTVINALALQNALEKNNVQTRVLSSIPIPAVCESYIRRRAINHMKKNRVIIFAAGTGNPYFTTDTAAVLRGIEINADIIIKGTIRFILWY